MMTSLHSMFLGNKMTSFLDNVCQERLRISLCCHAQGTQRQDRDKGVVYPPFP